MPGAIETDLFSGWIRRTADEEGVDFETRRAAFVGGAALRDISTPEDQAHLAVFLASDECRTITGQSIVCDGGVYMLG